VCTIVLEIGMLIMGIVALVKGKISLTANRVVYGIPARIIGALLMLPLPLVFGGVMVLGVFMAAQGKPVDRENLRPPAAIMEISILVIIGITVVVIGLATAGKPPRKKKRLPRDEPDENTFDNTAV